MANNEQKTAHRYVLGALPMQTDPLLKSAIERELRRVSAGFDDVDSDLKKVSVGGGSTGGVTQLYVDNQDAATLAAANQHSDARDATTLATAKAYAETKADEALTAAKAYTDAHAGGGTGGVSQTYVDAQDAATLAAAKAYTDAHAGSSGGTYPTAWQSHAVASNSHTANIKWRWQAVDILEVIADIHFGTDANTGIIDSPLELGSIPAHPTVTKAWLDSFPITRVLNAQVFHPVTLMYSNSHGGLVVYRLKTTGASQVVSGSVNFSACLIMSHN